MIKIKKMLVTMAVLAIVLTLAACNSPNMTKKVGNESVVPEHLEVSSADGFQKTIAEDYELDAGITYAVGIVKHTDMPDGWRFDGSGTEGFPKTGLKSWGFECAVLYYFNYPRLREVAEAYDPSALYLYFHMGRDPKWLSKSIIEEYVSRTGKIPYTGENIEENEYLKYFSEYARSHFETELTYEYHVDWEYRRDIEVGDVILLAIDPQLSVNPNEGCDEKWFTAVVSPFSADHPQPGIAKFIDGKLQLPADLQDAFELKRLYDDTDPELTGIKDGDSVEDVVAFLKAVEQDMIRYEQELKQRPASTDVSSIR